MGGRPQASGDSLLARRALRGAQPGGPAHSETETMTATTMPTATLESEQAHGLAPRAYINHLSLCSGAGGIDVALKLALGESLRTVCYVERNARAAATVVARMGDASLDSAPLWDCAETFDGKAWRGVVDLVSAGYPCQPFSTAGKRRGQRDPRHLWPHVRRIVAETRAELVFVENVAGHVQLGFDAVCGDLAALGYVVEAGLVSAAEVGASHERKRLFALGYRARAGRPRLRRARPGRVRRPVADSPVIGASGPDLHRQAFSARGGLLVCPAFPPGPGHFEEWTALLRRTPDLQPALRGVSDGVADILDRLRLCGNGVVPLAAAYAFVTLFSRLLVTGRAPLGDGALQAGCTGLPATL